MDDVKNERHYGDLDDLGTELDTLIMHGSPKVSDLVVLRDVVDNMLAAVTETGKPWADWLGVRWEAQGRTIRAETGDLMAQARDPAVAQYIVATHHECRDIPYAGGQLEIDIK